jgi:hypothetical protein
VRVGDQDKKRQHYKLVDAFKMSPSTASCLAGKRERKKGEKVGTKVRNSLLMKNRVNVCHGAFTPLSCVENT